MIVACLTLYIYLTSVNI